MSNAFASVLQARPSPAFGRPVHLRGSPLDYGPVLLLMPFEFHLAMDTLPSGVPLSGGFRSVLICFRLSPLCPFRRRHTFHSLRPATHYRRFRIQRSSSERWRDLNPPDQRAAQRKINTSRLHGHAAHAFFNQPSAHLAHICGKTPETTHRLGIAIRADGHPMLAASHIDPGGIRMYNFQRLPVHSFLRRPLLFACRLLPTHDFSYLNQELWTRPGSDS